MSWLPKQTVVVPIDFSEEADGAVDTALEVVEDASHVHVIHVLPTAAATEFGVYGGTFDDDSRREQTEMEIRKRYSDEKYKRFKATVAFGDPGSEIADFAQDQHSDLIVLPSHGRTGLSRLLIGSVAERVCRLAHCPVLVLRK
jgi:nucleotide-binding universal stress UspA family protein